jgi:hypothetical protein
VLNFPDWRSNSIHCIHRDSRESAERNSLSRRHFYVFSCPRRIVSFPCIFDSLHPNCHHSFVPPIADEIVVSLAPVCCHIINIQYYLHLSRSRCNLPPAFSHSPRISFSAHHLNIFSRPIALSCSRCSTLIFLHYLGFSYPRHVVPAWDDCFSIVSVCSLMAFAWAVASHHHSCRRNACSQYHLLHDGLLLDLFVPMQCL